MKLVVGSKNLSSWSLRPWLLMTEKGVAFEEEYVPFVGDWRAKVRALSPSARVPCLFDGDLVVPESLAIIEYVHELYPDREVWPLQRAARARARAVASEMHAGFAALRTELSMNLVARVPTPRLSDAAQADVARVQAIWREALQRSGGPYLYGTFTAADAMYAPVCTRFVTYGVELDADLARYAGTVLGSPAMRAWTRAAEEEVARERATGQIAG